jgi:hypothetical protein
MKERIMLGMSMLVTGVLCVGVTMIAAAWLDTVSRHERSAEIQAAVQVVLQGKTLHELPPQTGVVSPLMLWSTFAIGCYLLASGFVIGIRSLSSSRMPVPQGDAS